MNDILRNWKILPAPSEKTPAFKNVQKRQQKAAYRQKLHFDSLSDFLIKY